MTATMVPTYMTPKEVAVVRRCSVKRLADERQAGVGMPYIKDGRTVLYDKRDVEEYLTSLPRMEPIR